MGENLAEDRGDEVDALSTALTRLRDALTATTLRLPSGGVDEARGERDELANQISDHLLPRLASMDAPMLTVIGGSTGAGKSTIVNTIVGTEVTAAGVLRPTTRSPVLVCHPDDLPAFADERILPDLPRTTAAGATGRQLTLVGEPTMARGLGLLDAPDIDSVEEANRDLATQLLGAADLWLFTTTAARYADAVPWDFLRRAVERGVTLAVIINRIPAGAEDEIATHLRSMLANGGLGDVEVFALTEIELVDGRLPADTIAPISDLLSGLASDADRRREVIRRTLDGALATLDVRADRVVAGARSQDERVAELLDAVTTEVGRARQRLETDLSGGTLLRDEVLDRWQELIGTNEIMRALQSRLSSIRDRLTSTITGRTRQTQEVAGELTSTVERLIVDHADALADGMHRAWLDQRVGAHLVADDPSLRRASADVRDQAGRAVRDWQGDVLALVAERGSSKRTTARVLAAGLNTAGIALMILVFSQTGGLTGGEVAVASGTAGLSQTLLNALFGEQAVRDLTNDARTMLTDRIGSLFEEDANRYRTLLWAHATPPEVTAELAEAVDAVRAQR